MVRAGPDHQGGPPPYRGSGGAAWWSAAGPVLAGGLLSALLAGCGEGERPAPPSESEIFLLNLDPEQVSLDERDGVDLRKERNPGPLVRRLVVGEEARRVLEVDAPFEVGFHSVVRPRSTLRFGLGFRRSPPPGVSYRCEVLVRAPDCPERLAWSSTVPSSPPTENTRWIDVEVPLGDVPVGDVVLRTRLEDPDASPPPGVFPAWSNPILVAPFPNLEVVDSPPRNVILLLIDTLRADHLGTYGYAKDTSPRLDGIAAESVVFLQANAAASWTKASVASLFTSRLPSRHGAEGFQDRLRDSETTLAEVFAAAGYRTAAIGYSPWVFQERFNLGQGFTDDFEVLDSRADAPARAGAVIDEVVDWITRHREEKFFLYVHLIDPHAPYAPPEPYRSRFVDRGYDGPLDGSVHGAGTHFDRKASEVSPADLRHVVSLYDGEIAVSDAHLGRLVDFLRSQGLWEETTLVVTADHGEEFLDHGGWNHGGTLYQEQLNVPLVIKPPKSAGLSPRRIETPVSLIDVAPTLCRIARIPDEGLPFGGQDLIPLVSSRGVWEERDISSELYRNEQEWYAVRRGDLVYLSVFRPTTRERVHRLDSDPDEQVNLVEETDERLLGELRDVVAASRDARRQAGLYIGVFSDGTPAVFDVEVKAPNSSLDFSLRDGEATAKGDRFWANVSSDGQSLVIRAQFTLGAEDRRDSLLLRVTPQDTLKLRILLDGEPLDAERILIGPQGLHPPKNRIPIRSADERLLVEDPPRGDGREGVWCSIWRLDEAGASLAGEGADVLRDLGYVDD